MHVSNVLHAARWKCRTPKIAKISPSGHHRTNLSGYIFARHVSTIGKIPVKQQCPLHTSSQYGELRPASGWDLLASLGHSSKFQRVWRLGSVTAVHGTLVVGVSQTLRRWTDGTTYIPQGGDHVGHWPKFLVVFLVKLSYLLFAVSEFSSLLSRCYSAVKITLKYVNSGRGLACYSFLISTWLMGDRTRKVSNCGFVSCATHI